MAFHKSKPSSPKYQTLIARSIVSFCFLLLFVQVSTSVTSRFFLVLVKRYREAANLFQLGNSIVNFARKNHPDAKI